MKLVAIVNPIAGRGRAREAAGALRRLLARRGHTLECFETQGPGDARAVAAAAGEADALVVAGGDGTLNEAVNGLLDPETLPIGVLPLGTGNMLARELRLSGRPDALARALEHGACRWVDLPRVAGRRFLSVAGVGFDALVARRVAQRRTGPLGYLGYLRPVAETIARYVPPQLRVTLGEETVDAALVIVSNVGNYGGIFRVARDGRCDSGHLDVCVFRRGGVLDLGACALRALARRLPGSRAVTHRVARRLRIEAPTAVPVQIDGDPDGATPIEVDLDPARARILVSDA